jgi:hypothetical protein
MDQLTNPQTNVINPLMQRVRIPGETFTLPSGGVFYTHGELSPEVVNGEVHVYPMTAIDELIMKSVDKVFSGDAVKEIFGRCVPSVLQPGQLSAKDVDFLLVALRKVSYGPTFEMSYTHDCEKAELHTYEVSLDEYIRGVNRLNPTTIRQQFEYKTPNNQTIVFKPASYDDIVKMYQQQHAEGIGTDVSNNEELRRILIGVIALIDRVDDTTDPDMILEWLKSLPVLWLQSISEAAGKTTNWGIQFEVTVTCKDCNKPVKVPTPLNPISFFI